ncbi:trihelix transcription factor PTL [Cicer arietinum]|uniref:Trihelix transcription factor PTL n=1 Tax=Cicer arietinum TaxID=3827 RepID=A0A1S2XT47_CICAR|nr:trihelix transcription factor PTL [Cicer arietinum]
MEMDDNHHHHHQQHYGITDLRQLMNGPRITSTTTNHFSTAELFPSGNNPTQFDIMMFGRPDIMPPRSLHDFVSTDSVTLPSASTPSLEAVLDSSTGRWPRQETLTLLDIRSRLDSKFKEANQKGPLWDQISRIMYEEHGYQRNGKKCREKFENLYKYYKKTKEGRAGRQDGKHYRFFRQLEALYGTENINNNPSLSSLPENNNNLIFYNNTSQTNIQEMFHSHSLSLTNSTEFYTSSDDDDDDENDHTHSTEGLKENECSMEKKKKRTVSGRRRRSGWKVKIKDFIDSQMKKLVEKQEEWLDKLTKTLEQKEKERVLREQEWKKKEKERLEREQRFWAKERAWIETRDAALMEALQKLTGNEIKTQSFHEGRLNMGGGMNQNEDVNKKRKENSRSNCFYFDDNNVDRSCLYNNNNHHNHRGGSYCDVNDQREEESRRVQRNDDGSNSNVVVAAAESCFPFLMSEGGNLWENYSLKVNKANQNQ